MSLILAEPSLLRDIEVVTQCPPQLTEVMTLLYELGGCRPETGEDMGSRDPGSEGVTELSCDQPVEFCATHVHHANRAPDHLLPRPRVTSDTVA